MDLIFTVLILAPMSRLVLNFALNIMPFALPAGTEDVVGFLPWILVVVHPLGIATMASLAALAYNILASVTGGIAVDLE